MINRSKNQHGGLMAHITDQCDQPLHPSSSTGGLELVCMVQLPWQHRSIHWRHDEGYTWNTCQQGTEITQNHHHLLVWLNRFILVVSCNRGGLEPCSCNEYLCLRPEALAQRANTEETWVSTSVGHTHIYCSLIPYSYIRSASWHSRKP